MIDKFLANQPIILTLDVDNLLFERLKQIAEAGFSVVEINTDDHILLKRIRQEFAQLKIGAGNITKHEQLQACYEADVHFISSPGLLPSLAQTATIYSIHYLPGIATLSEAMQVIDLGYQQAKPFPASLQFCSLLNKYLPNLRLFPAEIDWDETEHYLNLPSVAAVSILNPESKHLLSYA